MAHQSLYRRYRPRQFADLKGQEPVVRALRNAVAHGTEGHAYLFSGPRGTGKTSTARILAKALNCEHLVDGEPCAECESCLSIEHGTSYDLFELDAASNNGVDAMRELVSRTVVGSPGRTKVYILDEVHMLSAAASNALLKTLEEPPEHVAFVLATTDPQKVLATIRSRTQHFEFSLLSAHELTEHVRWVIADAELAVDEQSIEHVVRQGRGSVRDTLSALDMVVAAGGVTPRAESVDEVLGAIIDRDTARAMAAISTAVLQGREPRALGDQLLSTLRDAFLASVHAELAHLSESDQEQMRSLATSLGTSTITRALESIGAAMVDMRHAADQRVPLEVAVIRLCDTPSETSLSALVERIDQLERMIASGAAPSASAISGGANVPPAARPTPTGPSTAPPGAAPLHPSPSPSGAAQSPAAIREQLARARSESTGPARSTGPTPPRVASPAPAAAPAPPAPSQSAPVAPAPAPAPVAPEPAVSPPSAPASEPEAPPVVASGEMPTLDELTAAMTDVVAPRLKGMSKAIYAGGRVAAVTDGRLVFALNNAPTRERAERGQAEVEAALAAHFGRPIPVTLVEESDVARATRSGSSTTSAASAEVAPSTNPPAVAPAPSGPEEDHLVDLSLLEDAPDSAVSGLDRVVQAFPGAVVVEPDA